SSSGKLTKSWELIELKASEFAQDKEMLKVVENTLAPYNEETKKKIGETAVPLARYSVIESSLDAVLADALREATGTEIALSNGFRFAYPLVPGPILEGDLWSIFPINTKIKTGKLTGKQLKDFYEREI